MKLFCKGIPTFEHPLGSVVDFGFGITDKRLEGNVQGFDCMLACFHACLFACFSPPSPFSQYIFSHSFILILTHQYQYDILDENSCGDGTHGALDIHMESNKSNPSLFI